MEEILQSIRDKVISQDLSNGGYLLSDTHFENGRNLHSQQYYFAKRFFQISENCAELASLLKAKLNALSLPDSITIVGFKNYSSLLLNKTLIDFPNFNYAIVEELDGEFIWQHFPILKSNLLVLLPITCTCSTYIKIRKFLKDFLLKHSDGIAGEPINILDKFINVFLILEESLKPYENKSIEIQKNKKKHSSLSENVYSLYSSFNWTNIDPLKIEFGRTDSNESKFTAYPLVRLYSKMSLPENCPVCFPNKDKNSLLEQPLFPTHPDNETPNVILGMPNFAGRPSKNKKDFFNLFDSSTPTSATIISGYTTVGPHGYVNYIRGNAFYQNNKESILDYFNNILQNCFKDDKIEHIVFITAESKYGSNFLEDLALSTSLAKQNVTILRFKPSHEYIENFISIYGNFINRPNNGVVYFEEILTEGKTFKLISDYLKHSRNLQLNAKNIHGFDYVFTLLDRTSKYVQKEIVDKLTSNKRDSAFFNQLISYHSLFVPNISFKYLGNPIKERTSILEGILNDTYLDSLKSFISKKLESLKPKALSTIENELSNIPTINEEFFPFKNSNNQIDQNVINTYYPKFKQFKQQLLRLFLFNELSFELSSEKYKDNKLFEQYNNRPQGLIEDIMKIINIKIEPLLVAFFVTDGFEKSPGRNKDIEIEIVHDSILRLLCQSPFIQYHRIYEAAFRYCLEQLDILQSKIEIDGLKSFTVFRRLKFYIRRSLDLNSNFIISVRFLNFIKKNYDKNIINVIKIDYWEKYRQFEALNQTSPSDLNFVLSKYWLYKHYQVSTYLTFLLGAYKELLHGSPYRSLKVEELVNSTELLPDICAPKNKKAELVDFLDDPYYHFTGMLKAENISLLHELKDLHKRKFGQEPIQGFSNLSRKYFKPNTKHDPIIIAAQKLLKRSRHFSNLPQFLSIRASVANMLSTVDEIQRLGNERNNDLHTDIKCILENVLRIVNPNYGTEKEKDLQYALCIEYKAKVFGQADASNIYTIVSDDAKDNGKDISLDPKGLIYRMLCGICDDSRFENLQTLLTAVKAKNGQFYSFQKELFIEPNISVDFNNLFASDVYNEKTGDGLRMLTESKMALIFRLADFSNKSKSSINTPEGQAILIITSKRKANISNYLDFMSNERVRLFLLIKNEILEYIQRQFKSGAFIDFLEDRKRNIYQSNLRHGLRTYLDSLRDILLQLQEGISQEENIELFDIISSAMKGQLLAVEISNGEDSKQNYKKDRLVSLFSLLFKSNMVADRSISIQKVDLQDFDWDSEKKHHHLIFDVILPEIIINMKKYAPLYGDMKLRIAYSKKNNCMIFENATMKVQNPSDAKKGVGIKMSDQIILSLNLYRIERFSTPEGIYTVVVNLNNK